LPVKDKGGRGLIQAFHTSDIGGFEEARGYQVQQISRVGGNDACPAGNAFPVCQEYCFWFFPGWKIDPGNPLAAECVNAVIGKDRFEGAHNTGAASPESMDRLVVRSHHCSMLGKGDFSGCCSMEIAVGGKDAFETIVLAQAVQYLFQARAMDASQLLHGKYFPAQVEIGPRSEAFANGVKIGDDRVSFPGKELAKPVPDAVISVRKKKIVLRRRKPEEIKTFGIKWHSLDLVADS
jgi:hypothetical protein